MVITITLPVIGILINAGCQPKFYVQYACTPQFEAIYTIIIFFTIFSFFIWIGVGLYYIVKFIRTRKIRNTIND